MRKLTLLVAATSLLAGVWAGLHGRADEVDIEKLIEQSASRVLAETQPTPPRPGIGSGPLTTQARHLYAPRSNATAPATFVFVRLKHDGQWDEGFDKNGDNQMLLEYRVRTGQPTGRDAVAMRAPELLANVRKVPPIVYMRGSKDLTLSKQDGIALRKYLLESNGMLLGDAINADWAASFTTLMQTVLPDLKPQEIPGDDEILRAPYILQSVPGAAADKKVALQGWKVKGRWVAVLHPADLGGLWAQGAASKMSDRVDGSYEFGVNVLFYAQKKRAAATQP